MLVGGFRFGFIPQKVNMITVSFTKSCPAEFVSSRRKEEIHMFGFPIVDFLESHSGFQAEGLNIFFLIPVPPIVTPRLAGKLPRVC